MDPLPQTALHLKFLIGSAVFAGLRHVITAQTVTRTGPTKSYNM